MLRDWLSSCCAFFFFNCSAPPACYTLSLHDALPILVACRPPMNCPVPAPPPSDARPPPWPACSNTAVVRISASRVRRISRKLYMRPGKYLGSAGLHKLRPAFGIERGAAHQDAIELAFGEEGGGVLLVHTSAVEDRRRRSASAC